MSETKNNEPSKISKFCNTVENYFHNQASWYYILLAVFTVIRIMIGADRLIQEYYLPHDDLLYLQLAHHLANGEWLGAFDPLTLAKSCIFPVFIALSILSGLPYLVFLDLLICGTAFIGVQALRPCINRFWSLVLYIILVFNPAYFFYQRLVIQDLYATLITGMIFCLAACWLRRDQEIKEYICWLIGGGIYFTLAAHSREEGKVLIAVFLGLYVLLLFDSWLKAVPRKEILRAACFFIAIPMVCYLGLNITIKAVNRHYYGIGETSIRNNRHYKGFIGSLLGAAKCLDPVWDIRIPLRYEVLDQLYEMSPTLKKLKPYMNRKNIWHHITNDRFPPDVLEACPNLKINTKGGFLQWEILYAMQKAKLYREGNNRMAEEFYKNVINELDTAAKQGKIPGFKIRRSNLVPFSRQMLTWFFTKFSWDAENIFTWGAKFIDFQPLDLNREHPGTVQFYFSLLKNNNMGSRAYNELMGWGKIPQEKMILRSQNFANSKIMNFSAMQRQDVQKLLMDRFNYQNIPAQAGFIMLLEGDQLKVEDNHGKTVYEGGMKNIPKNSPYVYIDHITEMKPLSSILWKRELLSEICLFYRNNGPIITLICFLLGFIGLMYGLITRDTARQIIDLLITTIMLWGTGVMYFCLIVFANVMLHCSRQPGYYMPAFALIFTAGAVIATGVLSVFCSGSTDDKHSESATRKEIEE